MKRKEYKAQKYGWNIIVQTTKKGWIVDIQCYLGWRRYWLPKNNFKEPLTEYEVRILGVLAESEGKKLGIPQERGAYKEIEDAYGNKMIVKV